MRCPECLKEDKRSQLYEMGSSITLLGTTKAERFWDERGVEHFHPVNQVTTSYQCSEGHAFSRKQKRNCPAVCGWSQ